MIFTFEFSMVMITHYLSKLTYLPINGDCHRHVFLRVLFFMGFSQSPAEDAELVVFPGLDNSRMRSSYFQVFNFLVTYFGLHHVHVFNFTHTHLP